MKRFVSLGAALMMGTVLSKQHTHKNSGKAIAKAEEISNDDGGFLIAKKDSVESYEEPVIFEENNDPQNSEGLYKSSVSPATSIQTSQDEGESNNKV